MLETSINNSIKYWTFDGNSKLNRVKWTIIYRLLRAPHTIDSACDRKTYKAKFDTAPTVSTLEIVAPTALS